MIEEAGNGETVVVTGAGRGLGRALCVEFAARGYRVAGLGRDPGALAATGELAGAGFLGVICDVADPVRVRAAFAHVRAAIGPVGVLVNNAAHYPRRDILGETAESFMATVAANLGGVVACSIEALADMTARGEGRILNVGSFADVVPIPASAAYAVSKGGVRLLTRAMVADLADRFPRIVVSDWMPGILATRMGMESGLDPAVAARWGVTLALWRDPSLNGTVWEGDSEVTTMSSLKGRVAARFGT